MGLVLPIMSLYLGNYPYIDTLDVLLLNTRFKAEHFPLILKILNVTCPAYIL